MEKKVWQAIGPDDFRPSETSLIDMRIVSGVERAGCLSLRGSSYIYEQYKDDSRFLHHNLSRLLLPTHSLQPRELFPCSSQ